MFCCMLRVAPLGSGWGVAWRSHAHRTRSHARLTHEGEFRMTDIFLYFHFHCRRRDDRSRQRRNTSAVRLSILIIPFVLFFRSITSKTGDNNNQIWKRPSHCSLHSCYCHSTVNKPSVNWTISHLFGCNQESVLLKLPTTTPIVEQRIHSFAPYETVIIVGQNNGIHNS